MTDMFSQIKKLDSSALGKIVRVLRTWRGLSQEKLGQSAGISANYVCQIEAGRGVRYERFEAIVCSMDYNPLIAIALCQLLTDGFIAKPVFAWLMLNHGFSDERLERVLQVMVGATDEATTASTDANADLQGTRCANPKVAVSKQETDALTNQGKGTR